MIGCAFMPRAPSPARSSRARRTSHPRWRPRMSVMVAPKCAGARSSPLGRESAYSARCFRHHVRAKQRFGRFACRVTLRGIRRPGSLPFPRQGAAHPVPGRCDPAAGHGAGSPVRRTDGTLRHLLSGELEIHVAPCEIGCQPRRKRRFAHRRSASRLRRGAIG
jgi:hypothetical protein